MRWLWFVIVYGAICGVAVLATGGIHDQFTHAQKIVFPIVGFFGATLWRGLRRGA
jgi:hypothetical protein